jgi:DNA polymerase-3 subunit delta'
VVSTAQEEASVATKELDATEAEQLRAALGIQAGKSIPRGAAGPLKDLEEQQGLRAKRFVRDRLDSVLVEFTGYYRDVLMIQTGNETKVVNTDIRPALAKTAVTSTAESSIHHIDAIGECRQALRGNVLPQLAVEAMLVSLGSL